MIDIRMDLRQFQITRSLNNPYAGYLWTIVAANCSISSLQVSGWVDAACSPMMAKAIMTKENWKPFCCRAIDRTPRFASWLKIQRVCVVARRLCFQNRKMQKVVIRSVQRAAIKSAILVKMNTLTAKVPHYGDVS